jgi:hypothetical protein
VAAAVVFKGVEGGGTDLGAAGRREVDNELFL